MADVLLPTSDKNKGGAVLSAGAILEAVDLLGLQEPVVIRWNAGLRNRGVYGHAKTHHLITLSTYNDAAQTSRTLWHELCHAMQRETIGSEQMRIWRLQYRYEDRPHEKQAREYSAFHEDLPLTK